jgi:hypothetical protein
VFGIDFDTNEFEGRWRSGRVVNARSRAGLPSDLKRDIELLIVGVM